MHVVYYYVCTIVYYYVCSIHAFTQVLEILTFLKSAINYLVTSVYAGSVHYRLITSPLLSVRQNYRTIRPQL